MNGNDGIRAAGRGDRRRSWATGALLALGGWLMVSPLVLSTTRVTAGMVSAVGSVLALLVLAGWARAARNPVPPLAIAMSFGLWLVAAPSLWEFRDGVDAWELVPFPAWEVTEPTRATIARAEWSSVPGRAADPRPGRLGAAGRAPARPLGSGHRRSAPSPGRGRRHAAVTASPRQDPAPTATAGAPPPDPDRAAVGRRIRRHPGDVVRVAVGATIVIAAAGVHTGRAGRLEAHVVRMINDLPDGLLRPLAAVLPLGALLAVLVVTLAALLARRVRLARDLAAAGALAWLLARLVAAPAGGIRPAGSPHAVPAGVPVPIQAFPSSHMAVAAALATAAAPHLPRPARRAAWALVALVGVARVYSGGLLATDALAAAALGWAAGGALHLLLGAPGAAPTAAQVAGALRRIGVDPVEVGRAAGDARGSIPFVVRDGDRGLLFVKAVGREQRDADLLYKLWRWAAFRGVEDEVPFASAKQRAEHEAYLSLLAARAGVRTPAVLTATPAAGGEVLLVQQHVAGRTLDRLDAARVDDRLLAAVWAEVGRLHAAGIAHRDLRRANLLVDPDGRPWLLDFGVAEAAAGRRRLAGDVAQLLASLACLVGPDRAVRSATRALGAEAVAGALPLLQPVALAAATRADLKARPGLLAALRERAAAAAGIEAPTSSACWSRPRSSATPGWARPTSPGAGPALVALSAALAAGGLLLWSPLGRRRLVIPALRAGRELVGVLRRPGKAAQLLGGSAAVTLSYALALAGCLAAFDAHLPLVSTVAVYLAGAAVASISPTPGGLGAMEAALVAGLTAVGAPTGPAVAGVLAFRLLTYWLPILPGWLAYRALRADGAI
jgi:tRNA A-37 threonylcarbamoyl transferase component Bud32/membrane-associated phospholipid phosphatase